MTFNKYGALPISVTFTPQEKGFTSHIWNIDGVQVGTTESFTKVFDQYDTYKVEHRAIDSCGSCAYSEDVIISAQPVTEWAIPSPVIVTGIVSLIPVAVSMFAKK
jgi:hypothetical protein